MPFLMEDPRPFVALKSEGEGEISRDTIVIASGAGKIKANTVLGKITATGATKGQYKPYDPTANDGTQTACAYLPTAVDATSGTVSVMAITRLAELVKNSLQWGANVTTQAHKDAAYTSLLTTFLVAR